MESNDSHPDNRNVDAMDWLDAELADMLDEDYELEMSEPALSIELRRIYKKKHPATVDRRAYFRVLLNLQAELIKLQDWVVRTGEKIVVIFEGRDSAGKGGAIKRITQRLNPRVCRVVALAKPSDRERTQWYFQRYVPHLPAGGEIVLFDRSWYNRSGVERVMGFASPDQVEQFFQDVPKFVQIARGNLALAVGLMVLLMVITVGYLPLVLPWLLPGVSVDPVQIGVSLVVSILVPLAGGLLVNEKRPNVAARVKPVLDKTSNLSLIILVVLQTVLNFRSIVAVFGTGGILAGMVFLAAAYAIGWALGGPTSDTRVVLGLGTAQRNIAAALVVANQSFDDPKVTVMIIVVTVVTMLVLIPLCKALGRRSPTRPAEAP